MELSTIAAGCPHSGTALERSAYIGHHLSSRALCSPGRNSRKRKAL